jgi:hypothetical protein
MAAKISCMMYTQYSSLLGKLKESCKEVIINPHNEDCTQIDCKCANEENASIICYRCNNNILNKGNIINYFTDDTTIICSECMECVNKLYYQPHCLADIKTNQFMNDPYFVSLIFGKNKQNHIFDKSFTCNRCKKKFGHEQERWHYKSCNFCLDCTNKLRVLYGVF